MFMPASGKLRTADFHVESADDGRTLKLRVRRIKNSAWIRLEPVDGFRPGARYLFRYLPAHRPWRHADSHLVTIDNATADSSGSYAIEPAQHVVQRVVTVPTSQGSCTKPVPVAFQAFSHAVPERVAAYRDALHYEVFRRVVATPGVQGKDPLAEEWGPDTEPTLYSWMNLSGIARGPRDAVIAPCATRQNRVRVWSTVAFPELDDRRHATRETSLDLSRLAQGECNELEALLQTMSAGSPEEALREACRLSLGSSFTMGGGRLTAIPIEEWERSLEFPLVDMGSSCNPVALAHAWKIAGRQPAPALVERIGRALQRGYRISDATNRQKAVHALAYLVAQLPDRYRSKVAPRLLMPLLPLLVDDFEAAHPHRLDDLARLIMAAQTLPPELRSRIQSIAAGNSGAAQPAQAILTALPR